MFLTGPTHVHAAHSDAQAHRHVALSRLGVDWRHLPAAELEVLLRHLLMAEHRCMRHCSVVPELPTNRWLLPRLRRRRLAVAQRLLDLGGRVSHATLARVLPRGTAWPGIAALVGKHAWDPVLDVGRHQTRLVWDAAERMRHETLSGASEAVVHDAQANAWVGAVEGAAAGAAA